MPLVLGKDCTITVGTFIANGIVKDVSWAGAAKKVEFQPFGQRAIYSHTCGYSLSADVTCNEDPGMQAVLISGAKVSVTSASGWSGTFVVTNVTRSEPLDGLVTATVSLELAQA